MQATENTKHYSLSTVDNKILESPRVVEWLKTLQGEFDVQHLSRKTQKSYHRYIVGFILWKYKTGCRDTAEVAMRTYLTHLTQTTNISKSTHGVIFAALLFFYRHVLHTEPGRIDADRPKRSQHLYVILSREEVRGIIDNSYGVYHLIDSLMYGCGLRIEVDCLEIRIKDVHLDTGKLDIRESKHGSARVLDIPKACIEPLRLQIAHAKRLHDADLAAGFGGVELPGALARKYPGAVKDFGWQFLFPAASRWVATDGAQGRPHIHVSAVQDAFRSARKAAKVIQPATPHCLRHCYATHSLEDGMDVQDLRKKLGHRKLDTTMVYTQYTQSVGLRSPLDRMYDAAANLIPTNVTDDVRRWVIALAGRLGISPGEAAGQIIAMAAKGGAL